MTKEEKIKAKLAEQEQKIREELELQEQKSSMEKLFEEEVQKFDKEMVVAKNKVFEALGECENIADKYSLPFHLYGCAINARYTPENFHEKWKLVDEDLFCDLVSGVTEWSGWSASQVC